MIGFLLPTNLIYLVGKLQQLNRIKYSFVFNHRPENKTVLAVWYRYLIIGTLVVFLSYICNVT